MSRPGTFQAAATEPRQAYRFTPRIGPNGRVRTHREAIAQDNTLTARPTPATNPKQAM